MGLKGDLTQLNKLELLDESSLETLKKSWITTLEELAGMLEADPKGIQDLLDLRESELEDLKKKVTSLLDPKVREAFEMQRGKKYPLGALDPNLRRPNQK